MILLVVLNLSLVSVLASPKYWAYLERLAHYYFGPSYWILNYHGLC